MVPIQCSSLGEIIVKVTKITAYIGMALTLVACAANAQLKKKTPKSPAPASRAVVSPVAKELQKQRIRACSKRGSQLADAITTASRYGVVIDSNPKNPNHHSATMVFSRQSNQPGMGTQLASVTLAPTRSGRCDTTVDLVYLWGQSCQQIIQSRYANYKQRTGLPGNVLVLQAPQQKPDQPMHQAYLMPLPKGCLVLEHNRS